jgi:hypothetical protein
MIVDRKVDVATGELLLVSVPSGANAVDEDCQIFLIGEDYSPVTDPKPVNLVHSLEAAHIALVFLTESLDGSKNPLPSCGIQACGLFEGSLGPLCMPVHLDPRRRRSASSWETTSPLAFSVRPSRIAARSSSVIGSSSRGASSRNTRRGSLLRNRRYSRKRLAATSSSSGSSSTKIWITCLSSMSPFYTTRARSGNPILDSGMEGRGQGRRTRRLHSDGRLRRPPVKRIHGWASRVCDSSFGPARSG